MATVLRQGSRSHTPKTRHGAAVAPGPRYTPAQPSDGDTETRIHFAGVLPSHMKEFVIGVCIASLVMNQSLSAISQATAHVIPSTGVLYSCRAQTRMAGNQHGIFVGACTPARGGRRADHHEGWGARRICGRRASSSAARGFKWRPAPEQVRAQYHANCLRRLLQQDWSLPSQPCKTRGQHMKQYSAKQPWSRT